MLTSDSVPQGGLQIRGGGDIPVPVPVMSGFDSSRSFPLKAKMHLTIAYLGMPWVIKQVKAETLLLGTTAKDCCLSTAGMGGQQR